MTVEMKRAWRNYGKNDDNKNSKKILEFIEVKIVRNFYSDGGDEDGEEEL